MRRHCRFPGRPLVVLLALMMAVAPCATLADADQGPAAPAQKTSLAAAARARVEASAPLRLAQDPTVPASSESRPFFKTPQGIAAIVLFVAGVGYTVYSKSHDRVKSPSR